VLVGHKVWVRFSVTNLTGQLITLRVPETEIAPPSAQTMGLPLAHVFSGSHFTALAIIDKHGELSEQQVSIPPQAPAPEVQLAPYASVGVSVELTQYYNALRRPGVYMLTWHPYDGQVTSEPLKLTVLAEQEALILTDFGKMRMRFFYDQAPQHVANFVELINMKFYDGLTFNRIIAGGLIQGGDPRGDRRGVRPDGKRLKAEFSQIPFDAGTVGMARSMRDPDSASCQFFITLARQPSFDGLQTAFAHLEGEESYETLRKIAAVQTDPEDRPVRPVYIRAISLENVPSKGWEAPVGGNHGIHGLSVTTRPADAVGPSPSPEGSASTTSRPAGR